MRVAAYGFGAGVYFANTGSNRVPSSETHGRTVGREHTSTVAIVIVVIITQTIVIVIVIQALVVAASPWLHATKE